MSRRMNRVPFLADKRLLAEQALVGWASVTVATLLFAAISVPLLLWGVSEPVGLAVPLFVAIAFLIGTHVVFHRRWDPSSAPPTSHAERKPVGDEPTVDAEAILHEIRELRARHVEWEGRLQSEAGSASEETAELERFLQRQRIELERLEKLVEDAKTANAADTLLEVVIGVLRVMEESVAMILINRKPRT